uniref:Uncharacterized protein n=1 Tax=Lepeophtheirus salmonis TaxID=72036 RepID=A0A0K2U6A2_LEPSM
MCHQSLPRYSTPRFFLVDLLFPNEDKCNFIRDPPSPYVAGGL